MAILREEGIPASDLDGQLEAMKERFRKVDEPTNHGRSSLDEIRSTPEGRQAVEDTVTDILRVLRHRENSIPARLSRTGTWLSTVVASHLPAERPPADTVKRLLRTGVTPIRSLFWRAVRSKKSAPDSG